MGENIEHHHFVALITEKLPQKVIYQLYMMKGEEAWTVKKLRELLGKHTTTMELAGGESHQISAHFPLNKPVSNQPISPEILVTLGQRWLELSI